MSRNPDARAFRSDRSPHRRVAIISWVICILAAGVGPLAGPSAAQDGPGIDVSVWTLDLSAPPMVNESIAATALVNTSGPATIEVSFTYGKPRPEGTGVRDPSTPLGYTIVRTVTAGTHVFTLGFTPEWSRRGEQEIFVTAWLSGGVSDSDPSNNTMSVKTFVRHASLKGEIGLNTTTVMPMGEGYMLYHVRNHGNFVENVTSNLTHPEGPWIVETYGPPPIPPGEMGTGVIRFRSSSMEETAASLQMQLSVVSNISPAVALDFTLPQVVVTEARYLDRSAPRFAAAPSSVQLLPLENRTFPFDLRNTGDIAETIRLNVTIPDGGNGWRADLQPGPEWPAGLAFPQSDSDVFVPLAPGGNATVRVNVTRVSADAIPVAFVTIRANSTNSERLAEIMGHAPAETLVIQAMHAGPDLAATLSPAPSRVYQGDNITLTARVENVGRLEARNSTVRWSVRDNVHLISEFIDDVPNLTAGASATLERRFNFDAVQGEHVILAEVVANLSDTDRDVSNNLARRDIHVRTPALTVRAPDFLEGRPGERLLVAAGPFSLVVRNGGDREESVLVTLASVVPWFSGQWRLAVPAEGERVIPLDILVPDFPEGDEFPATLRAAAEGRPRFAAQTSLALRLVDDAPPRVEVVSPRVPSVVETPATLSIRATDPSGVRWADVTIRLPDGDRVQLALSPTPSDPAIHAVTFTPPLQGVYALDFRAQDASTGSHLATISNWSWMVVEPAAPPLEPVGFKNGSVVGIGPLRLREPVPGRVHQATVDVGEGFVPLLPPYEFKPLPREGPVTVRVRVNTTTGGTWEGEWLLTLRIQAPKVEDASATPLNNGQLQLSARAPGAKSMVARFETPNGQVTANMTSLSRETFGAVVPNPQAWSSVTFLAYDAAGNVGSHVLERDIAPAPSVGLIALLGVVAVAARLARAPRR